MSVIDRNKSNRIKILLFGYINMNVMDGSAVFISSLATMLSKNQNISVDLVLANPIRRDLLLQPLYELDNVNIITPYSDPDFLDENHSWKNKNRMSYSQACEVISHYWNKSQYDWFIIRGIEVAIKLAEINPEIIRNSMVYMTGITHSTQEITVQKKNEFDKLKQLDAYILCQTEEMKVFLLKQLNYADFEKNIIPLNPMVPDTVEDFEEVFEEKTNYSTLCYTGKFDKGWNSLSMIVGFREVLEEISYATLEIAGDKFNVDKDNPNYIRDLKYLLNSTKNLTWHGAISRIQSRQLIKNSDIGITWRDKSMDTSLELSTKLLEYGTLGKAVILNPTDMHINIFGEDYPLYAETMEQYIEKVKLAINDPIIYKKAAKIMFEKSKNFTFSEILNNLLPYLIKGKVHTIINKELKNTDEKFVEELVEKVHKCGEFYYSFSEEKSLLVKNLRNIESYFEMVSVISKYGIVKKYEQIGKMVFLFIEHNKDNFYENYYNNISIDILKVINSHNTRKSNNNISLNNTTTKINTPLEKNRGSKMNKKYMVLESRYNALANSKLGKLQLKYWKLKKN
ncbi:glycosyltransferase family protein [Gracilibacillus massiliensis]|uniref:glycosyltransferase n=1 Tax=Gracilibacillus massiliensis TaxID=1564956 RepID=UPI00071E470A|nr:glycosyltransferase [Gracilibacillus massiliensis]